MLNIDDEVIEILCCPSCRGDLSPGSPQRLICISCGETFGSSDGILEMFKRTDLLDGEFLKYREAYEEHAKRDLFSSPSDITQWSCLKMLAKFMGRCENHVILDVGSADGKLGKIISGRVICFDISRTYLKAAHENGMRAFAGKAESLPFKRIFDSVVLSNILEHVPRPEVVMEQVEFVLKPTGRLYVVVPYKEDLLWQEGEDFLDPHLTSFDLPRISALLRNFTIMKKKFILFSNSRPSYFLKSFLKKRLSPNMFNRLRETKKALKKRAETEKFSLWRHALNYLPDPLVMPFFRPFSILIEAKWRS